MKFDITSPFVKLLVRSHYIQKGERTCSQNYCSEWPRSTTFDGCFFTIQALRLYHPLAIRQCEIAVVDNNPTGPHGQALQDFLKWIKGDVQAVHYVPFTATTGTAAPRDHIFSLGTAPAVLCLDSHILLVPGALQKLLDWYEAHPDTRDLHQGPMVYDDLKNQATHFTDVWGDDQMWGKWERAWLKDDLAWEAQPKNHQQTILRRLPAYDAERIAYHQPIAGEGSAIRWEMPQEVLVREGYRQAASAIDEPPFEIPAMGLGLFSCRRDAWLGFNPRFRGFGGEEWYIHEKFRKAGHKTLCLPFLRWLHRFGRPGGVKYPLQLWDKARNYVIGLTELGIPLDRAKESFVGSGKISEQNWQALLDGKDEPVSVRGCGCSGKAQPATQQSLDELFTFVKQTPRDLNEHADYIRSLAAESSTITAFVKRREWNVLLAAGHPSRLTVYQSERDPLLQTVHAAVLAYNQSVEPVRDEGGIIAYTTHEGTGAGSLSAEIEPCGLLVIDTEHNAGRLWAELTRHGDKAQRILIRGTGAFGEKAEGADAPGLLPAIRRWVKENSAWTVTYHTVAQYGLTLLSRRSEDKKELPSLWKQGVNAAKASWRAGQNVLTNYGPLQDTPTQDERLALCLLCDQQTEGRCAACGCPLDRKTSFDTESCPLGKWGRIEPKKEAS